jgi:hypothetical protein
MANKNLCIDERIFAHLRDEAVLFVENMQEGDEDEMKDHAETAGYETWEEFKKALKESLELPTS